MDKSLEVSDELRKLAIQASIEMEQENPKAVLKLAEGIEALPEEPSKTIVLSGTWINAGDALGDESVVSRGIELLEKHSQEYEGDNIQSNIKLTYFYYLGNGYAANAKMKRDANSQYGFFREKESDFHKAIRQYRKALRYTSNDLTTTQTYVNLGNNLNTQGRCLEALECYEKALSISPDFGMALGNKGLGLKYYARISGEHWVLVLSEAHHLLDLAWKSRNTPDYARGNFLRAKQEAEKILGDRIISPPFSSKYKNPGVTQVEKDYLDYGLRHGLYLNACNFCSQRCNRAIEDTFTIKTMVVPVATDFDDDPFLRMQNWMNQIRVAYATARYLLFQATQSPEELEFVLKHVRVVETLDYSIFDIETELLKVSFRFFYSILDQIAWILNDYLELGIPLNKIYFNRVWHKMTGKKKNKKKVVRPELLATQSWSLNALYDLNLDLENSAYYGQLRKMRNCLIHRFIDVSDFQMNPTEDKMDREELERRCIEIARLVRNAVAYLMFFLWKDTQDEAKRKRNSGSIIPTMTLDDRP